jgi:hypothetical protein
MAGMIKPKRPENSEENLSSTTFSSTNPTVTTLGLFLDVQSKKKKSDKARNTSRLKLEITIDKWRSLRNM